MFGQMSAIICLVFSFSPGLALLPAFGLIYTISIYIIYKLLILKHYSKSSAANEEVPLMSIAFMKLGIIIHLIIGFIVFTDKKFDGRI